MCALPPSTHCWCVCTPAPALEHSVAWIISRSPTYSRLRSVTRYRSRHQQHHRVTIDGQRRYTQLRSKNGTQLLVGDAQIYHRDHRVSGNPWTQSPHDGHRPKRVLRATRWQTAPPKWRRKAHATWCTDCIYGRPASRALQERRRRRQRTRCRIASRRHQPPKGRNPRPGLRKERMDLAGRYHSSIRPCLNQSPPCQGR